MKNRLLAGVMLVLALAGCSQAQPVQPAAAPPQAPTAAPPPMAGKLMVFGDTVLFLPATQSPDSCTAKSRFKRGEPVGFRVTVVDPMTGKTLDGDAEVVVTVTYGNKSETVAARDRATGNNPHPGMWTAKWVVPADAPAGIVKYTASAKSKDGRTGEWNPATSPFGVEPSMLAVVN